MTSVSSWVSQTGFDAARAKSIVKSVLNAQELRSDFNSFLGGIFANYEKKAGVSVQDQRAGGPGFVENLKAA
eukprot:9470439-Pyramimonas_sp.AAC.1